MLTEPAETLETLTTLVVGNALVNDIRGDAAVKKLVGADVLIPQILGDDQDGGVLFEQLAPGGRLVAPIGPQYGYQELEVHAKDAAGDVLVEHGLPVAFVPFVHEGGAETEAEEEEMRVMKLGDRSDGDA